MIVENPRVLVVGGSGGIGLALTQQIRQRFPKADISSTYYRSGPDPQAEGEQHYLDVRVEDEIRALAAEFSDLDLVINAVGFLHDSTQGPEKSLQGVEADFFAKNIALNTLPTLLLAKHFAGTLRHGRPAVFAAVSAKVGSIEDNRLGGWHSYRCSKAALNMALKNISIEWQRRMPKVCVASLHPGTTATALSEPFQKNVKPEKLFAPATTANYLLDVIGSLTPDKTGRFWSWDGSEIPW